MSRRTHHRRSAMTLPPPYSKVRPTPKDGSIHRRDAVQLPAFRSTTVLVQPTTRSDVVEAVELTTHTVAPCNRLPEPAHWNVLRELQECAQIETKIQAVDETSPPLSHRHGTAADRIKASWSLYDAMNQSLTSKPRDSTAALDILKEIGRYRRLADVFKQLDANHDGVVTRDELVAWATRFKIPLTDADALLAFMDRNHDGTVTCAEVDVLVKQFGGASPSPPRDKSKQRPVPSRLTKLPK